MGAVVSRVVGVVKAAKAIVGALRDLHQQFSAVLARAATPPGLPVPNPTRAFWQDDPPFPELVDIRSPALPDTADVVIIGSGITGAAVARSVLHLSRQPPGTPLPRRVVVLEARQLCSGATGRNGGHIKASPHELLAQYRKSGLSTTRAAALVRFQLRALPVLTGLCEAEGFEGAECREVETVDLFASRKAFAEAVEGMDEVRRWLPEVTTDVWSAEEAREVSFLPAAGCYWGGGLRDGADAETKRFDANDFVVGALSYTAGALWPYRFVTAVWRKLLDEFPDVLSIETGTPVEAVQVDGTDDDHPYRLQTPRGVVRARHVVHATNGFTSHLVPKLRSKMVGLLATMSAQRPGSLFPDLGGRRSWSFLFTDGFDYITQRPPRDGVPGELMVGGGYFQAEGKGLENIGVYDDSKLEALACSHLEGVMPTLFAPKWGDDGAGGRTKALWSGVIALSADGLPFVGRLDTRITGRKARASLPGKGAAAKEAASGEWIAAAFIGDGMVWSWLCGTALGAMIVGRDKEDLTAEPGRPGGKVEDWLPKELLPTYERIQRIDLADLAEGYL